MSEHFQADQDALAYEAAHDDHAKRLSRASMTTLRGLAANERQAKKIILLEGGQGSKDELIAEVLALRYPLIAEARQFLAGRRTTAASRLQAELDAQAQS